ncbi:MAG: phosphotransacetylase family protein [SAR202 cluster bacterium]|nr:phosphotransacetylase family protein [SAR202 cluster bacterium]
MTFIYIATDRPGAGKTAAALGLAAHLLSQGKRAAYAKLFSGNPAGDPDVAFAAQRFPGAAIAQPDFPFPLSDLASNSAQALNKVKTSLTPHMSRYEAVVVEGPSLVGPAGDMSGISKQAVQTLGAKAVLVARYEKGVAADTLRAKALSLGTSAGVIINMVPRYRLCEVQQALAPLGKQFLGAIPEDRVMMAPTLGQVARQLNAQWVMGQEKSEVLLESFLIGGNIMDSGTTYFGRNEAKAVVVRGDRPDLQLAALREPLRALILTGGHEPVEYIFHEVETRNTPLIITPHDTHGTSNTLGALLESVSVRHPAKISRFQDLLNQYCNIPALIA